MRVRPCMYEDGMFMRQSPCEAHNLNFTDTDYGVAEIHSFKLLAPTKLSLIRI